MESSFSGVRLMTGNAKKQIRRIVGSTIAILIFCSASTFALQEKISPLSDYQYNKKDLPQYETIIKETDPLKRADLFLAFVKERPISKLLINVVLAYQDCVKPQLEKKDYAKAIAMEEALLALLPTDETLKAAEIPVGVEEFKKEHLLKSQIAIQKALLAAYYGSNNLPKAAETGEKIYALESDKAMLSFIAETYLKMQNYDKYLSFAQKILTETPIEQGGYGAAIQMAQVYIQKQDLNNAIAMLSKVMDVYGDKAPPNVSEDQWNPTRAYAYGVIATGVYAQKDYVKALELYEKVAKFDPKRDDAYYYIGMSKWQNKDPEGAMEPFAKCVVLNKQFAKRAQTYLEQIYKGRNKDSLEGLDKILAKAKADLGIN
jgi:tetratricopeptide (TPR) repeat protein